MINISKNKCIGCGICINVCSKGIEILDGIARIKNKNKDCLKDAIIVCPQRAIKEIKQDLLFAIGTDQDQLIKQNDHVGMSKYFQIWKYSNGNLDFKEKRENVKYKEDGERIHGDSDKAKSTTSVLEGIDVLVGKMFGPNIIRLKDKFVCTVIREPKIKKAIEIIKENINEIVEEYDKEKRSGIVLK